MEQKTRKVDFSTVEVRVYVMTLGDNPAVSLGPPVCLSEEYSAKGAVPVEEFEKERAGKRRKAQSNRMKLNYYQRYEILHEAGFDDKGIKAAERGVSRARLKRNASYYYCYPYIQVGKVKAQFGRMKNNQYLRKQKSGRKN